MTTLNAITAGAAPGAADNESMNDPAACDAWIRRGVADFDRWFCHVDFGNGIVARSTAWPDASLDSPHMGVAKFRFIVQRNLPDLAGKRVLELGCNAGAVAMHMASLGAREVVGVDSERHWPGWQAQAEFVKQAMERRHGRRYDVRYVDADIADLPDLGLGTFDVVIALNCLYYLDSDAIDRVVDHVARHSPRMLIQCNVNDHDHYLGNRAHPAFMQQALRRAGYGRVRVDWPWDRPRYGIFPRRYHRPVVVGWH